MDKCPFCEAPLTHTDPDDEGVLTDYFDCGSWVDANDSYRGKDCYEREIAQLTARLEQAEQENKLRSREKSTTLENVQDLL